MEYYSAIKKKQTTNAQNKMKSFKTVMVSDISQTPSQRTDILV